MKVRSTATPFWETAYQLPSGSAFGKPSAEIISLADTLLPKSCVLDLGCGEGRNALFLAQRGFDVTAVDISSHGVNKLRSLASERGLALRSEVADMRSWRFEREFDVIVSHGCLHLIERTAWQEVLLRIKSHTVPGGYNIVAVFTDRLAPPPDLEPFCIGLFKEGELFTSYQDWQVQTQQSYTIHDEHPGGIRHTHPINKIVARKPGLL